MPSSSRHALHGYQTGLSDAIRNAGRFLQEAGAQAVKLEGGAPVVATVRAGVLRPYRSWPPGLTPQSINQLGRHKVQARPRLPPSSSSPTAGPGRAGAFAVVLECVPAALAKLVTERLSFPRSAFGAGPLRWPGPGPRRPPGLDPIFTPPREAIRASRSGDTERSPVLSAGGAGGRVPTAKESFSMDEAVLTELSEMAV